MGNEVVVSRKGRIRIPVKFRRKYCIREGARLQVIDTDDGILMKPGTSILDLAGIDAKYATPEEMKRLLDELRDEDA